MLTRWLKFALLTLLACTACGRSAEQPEPVPQASSEPLTVLPGENAPVEKLLQDKFEKRSAKKDSWQGEVLNSSAGKKLKILGHLIEEPHPITAEAVAEAADAGYSGPALRPASLVPAFQDTAVDVRRGVADDLRNAEATHQGHEGLARALTELAGPFANAEDIHTKFKIFRVDIDDEGHARTAVYYLASGHAPAGVVQQNATWEIDWKLADGPEEPKLQSIRVVDYEEVVTADSDQALFSDCTEAVLAANPSWQQQLLPSLDHWRGRIERNLGIRIFGHNGLTVGDVNGDGLDDLFIAQGVGLPDRLFTQNLDGTATDISSEAGVDALTDTKGALMVDLDNDGDQDLLVATSNHVVVMENDGKARFTARAALEAMSVISLAAADYDLDGDLDVFANCYQHPEDGASPLPYHDANNGQPNHMFRNDGGFAFSDVTEQSGFDHNNRRFSFSAAWEDYDNDGDLDLYVANDFGRNNLYRNDDGHFSDVAAEAGVEDIAAGMGVTWSDLDRDGDMDLYVANMFSSAGGRVAYQRRFQPEAASQSRAGFQRHARGNTLFENNGDGTFTDVSEPAGVTMGRWAWGALAFDMNNDGFDDLFVPNGLITNEVADDL
jgi:hypothetical protein